MAFKQIWAARLISRTAYQEVALYYRNVLNLYDMVFCQVNWKIKLLLGANQLLLRVPNSADYSHKGHKQQMEATCLTLP